MKEVWQTDATYIKSYNDFDENSLVENRAIQTFLNIDKGTRHFVVATKGFGKTFLLRYKRLLYQTKYINTSYNFIPKNQLVDRTLVSIDFNKEQIDLFNDEEIWKDTWELAIIISFIKSYVANRYNINEWAFYDFYDNVKELTMTNKLLKTKKETPLDYLAYIIKLNYKDFYSLRSELEDLTIATKMVNYPTAIFIDDIDEIFTKHLQSQDAAAKYSRAGVLCYNVWYLSQIGLMKAVRGLYDINPQIKIFASIRKEAYIKFKDTDEKSLQFKGKVLDLNYTQEELKEMFTKNIQMMGPEDLIYPEKVKTNPIVSFLGLEELPNRRTGDMEKIFPYIYRHTLKRPRDIMSIGDALNQLDNKSIDEIITTVNSTSEDIAKQYIEEVSPHIELSIDDFDKLFSSINTKIITKRNLRKICENFNSVSSCENNDCKKCMKTHVFCNLYKIGLLGIVKQDYLTGKYKQHFLKPGEMTFNTESCLPESPFYFIHPVLTKYILESNSSEYILDRNTIVGDGYDCDLDLLKDLCIKNLID
ncbi:P-loop ATPase, Sll1717 family [Methanosarcina barkeri]|uniref:Uncharacterized protein n=1 Tax=Methanosarcina barkeri 227 TaxID=1434106 RepID=A0A0E3R4I2_METBA|nr:hypothetical protein [Methanosarcina barkeri]AKB59489.1 hypothetical protein MSBR2_2973 [Methanosarcina barkeri 227]